jgi:flavin-dependent dehydrogenase
MSETNYDFDLIIIGGGPAGSSLSLLLPENIKILIVDKSNFPRDKICGECLSPGAIDIINEIGLEKIFQENHVEKIYGVTFKAPNLKSSTVLYPDNRYGYAIPRIILDKTLIEQAKKRHNITILESFNVENITIEKDFALVKGITKGQKSEFKSKLIVGADGRYSTTAKLLNMYESNDTNNRHVYVATLDNVKDLDNTIELEIKNHELQYLVSKQKDNIASIAVVINDNNFNKKDLNVNSYFDLLKQSSFIKNRIEHSKLETKLKGISLNKYKLKSLINNRLLFVGDSTGFIDPITGEGMYRAFKTSKFASKVIVNAIEKNDFSKEFLSDYELSVLKEFNPIYFFIKTAVFLTTNELVANTIINNMNSMKELGEKIVSLQGAIIPARELFSYNTLKLFAHLMKKQMISESTL